MTLYSTGWRDINLKIFFSLLLLSFALLGTSCSEQQREGLANLGGQMGGMFSLKEMIDGRLEEGESAINISNGVALTVSLVNTKYNETSKADREAIASELLTDITGFIEQNNQFSAVKYLGIIFVKHETKFLIINYTESIDLYQFDLEKLQAAVPSSGA